MYMEQEFKTGGVITFFYLYLDVDECTNGSHDCDMNANCTNIESSFTCQCITGYYGDGHNCTGKFHS